MLRRLLLVLLAAALLAACQSATAREPGDRLRVVATYSILGDIAQHVGGDKIALRTLVGPDGDAHTFEPSPADAAALAEAQLVLENGLDFETWLDKLYEASRSTAPRVVATEGIAPLTRLEDGREELDPHVWHDVTLAIQMTRNVRDALVAADPANTAYYTASAEAYLTDLQALDIWTVLQVQSLPPSRRLLVTSHDALGYFVTRYGFKLVVAVLSSVSTEVAEPSAGDLAKMASAIRAVGVPAIFAENVHNPRIVARLAAEAGVAVAPPLYTDALGKPGSEGDTYVKMMRWNVSTIVGALNP
jgi:ABC-type Zn uptake system ZnuABC Zn-binding protein ZnuA